MRGIFLSADGTDLAAEVATAIQYASERSHSRTSVDKIADDLIQARTEYESVSTVASFASRSAREQSDRLGLRERIADELYGEGAEQRARVAYIVLGPPGAGKTKIAKPIAAESEALLIDADEAKRKLPEYDEGRGANAVHEESVLIRDALLERAVRNGDNIVLPMVGRDFENLRTIVSEFREAGYAVHVRLVHVLPQLALNRTVLRFVDGRHETRYVDPGYVFVSVGMRPLSNYRRLLSEAGPFESATAWDNSGPNPIQFNSGSTTQ